MEVEEQQGDGSIYHAVEIAILDTKTGLQLHKLS